MIADPDGEIPQSRKRIDNSAGFLGKWLETTTTVIQRT